MGHLVHVEATNLDLREEAIRLTHLQAEQYLSDQRKAVIAKEIGYIFFELDCRNGVWRERHQPSPVE